jgi:hypothetical protein
MAFSHADSLLGQKAAYDPYSGFAPALFDLAIVPAEPASDLFGDMPTGVIPDEKQDFLASRFEHFATPLEKLGCYPAHGPTVHEPDPRLIKLRQIEPVAGDGFRIVVIFRNRPLDEALGFPFLGPATQSGQGHPAPPSLILEAYSAHSGLALATSISRSRRLFSLV